MLDDNPMEKKNRPVLPPAKSQAVCESSGRRDFPPVKNGSTPARSNPKSPASGYQSQQKQRNPADRRAPAKSVSAPKIDSYEVNDWECGVDPRTYGGGKKKNFNQLLSFTSNYQPQRHESGRNWRQSATVHRRLRLQSNSAADYNKERFLQANCQFIVAASGNYAVNMADPDVLVDWNLVEELRLIDETVPTCPICLSPPVAGKITRCGHIFCWSCILHYLALSDETWRKCPICYESVYKQSLKSVVAIASKSYGIGCHLTMKLMRKEKGTTVVLPKSQWSAQHEQLLKLEEQNSQFAKILVISADEVKSRIVHRERVELETLLAAEKNEPESCFILEALEFLRERETGTPLCVVPRSPTVDESKSCAVAVTVKAKQSVEPVTFFLDAFEDVSELRTVEEAEVCDNQSISEMSVTESEVESIVESSITPSSPTGSNSDRSFYFYQAEDGQPIYLHSVNAKCLTHEFGSLEYSPNSVSGRIVELERYVMTEELRLRFRYLAHLPLTTNFTVVELNFDRNIVQRDTIEQFADEFHRRHVARQKRVREEKKQTVQAQKWERAMLLDPRNYAMYKNSDPADIPVTTFVKSGQSEVITSASAGDLGRSVQQGPVAPVISDAAYPELGASVAVQIPNETTEEVGANRLQDELDHSPQSFAQMLRSGRSNKQPTVVVSSSIVSENVTQPQARWPVMPSERKMATALKKDPTPADADDTAAPPDFQNAFGNALEAAFAGLSTTGNSDGGKKGKFKKGKGRLLFST